MTPLILFAKLYHFAIYLIYKFMFYLLNLKDMEYNSTYKPNQTKDSSIMYRSIKRTPERKRRIIVTDNGLKKSLEEIENVISHHKRSYQHEQYSEPRYYKVMILLILLTSWLYFMNQSRLSLTLNFIEFSNKIVFGTSKIVRICF